MIKTILLSLCLTHSIFAYTALENFIKDRRAEGKQMKHADFVYYAVDEIEGAKESYEKTKDKEEYRRELTGIENQFMKILFSAGLNVDPNIKKWREEKKCYHRDEVFFLKQLRKIRRLRSDIGDKDKKDYLSYKDGDMDELKKFVETMAKSTNKDRQLRAKIIQNNFLLSGFEDFSDKKGAPKLMAKKPQIDLTEAEREAEVAFKNHLRLAMTAISEDIPLSGSELFARAGISEKDPIDQKKLELINSLPFIGKILLGEEEIYKFIGHSTGKLTDQIKNQISYYKAVLNIGDVDHITLSNQNIAYSTIFIDLLKDQLIDKKKVRIFSMTSRAYEKFPNTLLDVFDNLREVHFADTNITQLEASFFDNAAKLEKLRFITINNSFWNNHKDDLLNLSKQCPDLMMTVKGDHGTFPAPDNEDLVKATKEAVDQKKKPIDPITFNAGLQKITITSLFKNPKKGDKFSFLRPTRTFQVKNGVVQVIPDQKEMYYDLMTDDGDSIGYVTVKIEENA